MKVVWSAESIHQIEAITDYIAEDDPNAAYALADRIFTVTETVLSKHPKAGRPGRVEGTRELLVHASYIVAYEVTDEMIGILTVRHTARLWPDSLHDTK